MSGARDAGGSGRELRDPSLRRAADAVAHLLPLAVVVDGDVVEAVAPSFAVLAGLDADACAGKTLGDVLGDLGDRLAAAVTSGAVGDLELSGALPDGREQVWTVTLARPALDAAVPGAVVVWVRHVHEPPPPADAEEPADSSAVPRLELLRRAGEVLSSSLEPQQTLENLCDLLVPAVADHVFVDLHDGDVLRRMAIRHVPGTHVPPGLERPLGVPASYEPSHPVQRAFDAGESLLVRDFPSDPRVPRYKGTELLDALGVRSVIVVPLRARGRALGGVILARATSERRYDDDDLRLASELVDLAGSAVANSLRYDAQRRAAVELQRSLLPQSLDPTEGLDVAWSYVPGTDGTEVGGDWADVVELPGGRVAVVVGDVMGRGLRAAAVMGQLRTAVRTLALQDPLPADLLSQLDRIVRGLDGDQIVTCVYGVYDPARGTMTVANAGHLPPLLVLEGRCLPLEGVSAVPLGVGGVEFTERVVPMPRGATMALYTDGLVEARDADLEEAVARLGQVLQEARGTLSERCTTVLLRSASGSTAGFSDDVALLLVQALHDPAAVAVQHLFPAAPESVAAARRAASGTLSRWHLDDEELQTTSSLLVSELVTNAVLYAQGEQVELTMRLGESAVWLEVVDRDTRSPRLRHASLDDEGGRGLALVQALSAAWGTRGTRDGKVVWVRLDRPDPRTDVGAQAV